MAAASNGRRTLCTRLRSQQASLRSARACGARLRRTPAHSGDLGRLRRRWRCSMWRIAKAWRGALGAQVVAVPGASGKPRGVRLDVQCFNCVLNACAAANRQGPAGACRGPGGSEAPCVFRMEVGLCFAADRSNGLHGASARAWAALAKRQSEGPWAIERFRLPRTM